MKKTVFLIVIVCISGCRYFNISPVNGLTTKNIAEKLKVKELAGRWEADKFTFDFFIESGYQNKKIELILNDDESFKTKNFPDVIDVFNKNNSKDYINVKGKWKIEKSDFENDQWILNLYFENDSSYTSGLSMSYDIYLRQKELILWSFIGDPDSGDRFLLKNQITTAQNFNE